ncbi:hypothetical protein [Sphingobacterium yanglingense]|uniref:Lipocalin-like protein n=1 Tax=Sphingobacterium yanglingense TaxID=1437280 RepID=A0A4R6WIE5_9SPHI|nr:hypothetical protein [Sphingobacterium yanglingense]TDQ78326.1 hypothetical protein CLV99_2309 [Sphingobacterium yanglingense]
MTTKNIFLILLTFLSFSALGQQDQSEDAGLPKLADIIGFWKKVEIPNESKANKVNPWPQKYQWFSFYENGKVYSMMADKDYDYTSEDLKEIFDMLPADKTPNYEYDGEYVTIDNKENEDYLELWGVNLFYRDIKKLNIKKGNLMMTLDDGNERMIYFRLLKRIE